METEVHHYALAGVLLSVAWKVGLIALIIGTIPGFLGLHSLLVGFLAALIFGFAVVLMVASGGDLAILFYAIVAIVLFEMGFLLGGVLEYQSQEVPQKGRQLR